MHACTGAELLGELEIGSGLDENVNGAGALGVGVGADSNSEWNGGCNDGQGHGHREDDVPKRDDLESRLANLDLGSGFF
eukprot:351557-Chlamydomonas_euryale.AAC.11